MLFFSKNRIFSLLIILVSFITPFPAFCGLIAVAIALITAEALGFNKAQTENGLLTYSVVLFGLGLGSNFESSTSFYLLLVVGALLTLFLSVVLNAILNKRGLPALSLAFIMSTCLLILASKSFSGIGLTHRQVYWYNQTYAIGGSDLVNLITGIENWKIPDYVSGFFRSMSAILFQVNVASGIILSIGLLIYSRIGFLLMVFGYAVAIAFGYLMGSAQINDMSYYNMGTNFMLVAIALGGFYIIPSIRSFLWVLILVPIAFLLVTGVSSIMFKLGVPVFSLPFCLTVILFLYMLKLRGQQHHLVLTPIQYYSPEVNLYRYLNGKERLMSQQYLPLQLPFMGEWMVSQGYDGSITHKGDWSKAIDFVILDQEMKTYCLPGNLPEHFYCYNKPVLNVADGIVEEIVDHIDDNEIGGNNTQQNWGNTIIIKHAEGLYSKLSHLKKQSFAVVKGAYVKKGEILAYCGNSGRSPEPHLHIQLQSTPNIGSKTMAYPFSYFTNREGNQYQLKSFTAPKEGKFVSNLVPNSSLQQAFNFQPGFQLNVIATGYETERWEVCSSVYNETYLYCKEQNSFAYFINNGSAFYFTNYFGSKKSLLYLFYQVAYHVVLSSDKAITVTDYFPLNNSRMNVLKWLQDLVSPFYLFIRMRYVSKVKQDENLLQNSSNSFESEQTQELFWKRKKLFSAVTRIEKGQLDSFTIHINHQTIQVQCSN
jgi:urea transporter